MKNSFKILIAVVAVSGFLAAGMVLAQGNGVGNLNNSKPAKNYSPVQIETLKKEYARLLELIAKLQGRMNQTATSTTPLTVDLTCAQPAVAARETAIATAFGAMSSCTITALTSRKNALATAWTISAAKDRNKAINQAWDDFKKARKACQSAYKTAVKSVWETFKTTAKTCKIAHEEANNEGIDLSLE